MLKKILFLLATTASLLLFATEAKAGELIHSKSIYPKFCEMAVDSWKRECSTIELGLVPDYDTFNLKLCTKNKQECIIFAGEAEELNNYSTNIVKLFSVARQEGEHVIENWSGDLVLKSDKDGGFTLNGLVEDVVIKIYFTE